MSNYIDLEPKVSDYYGTTPGQARRAGVCDALRYLDSHPDQAPGRTITASDLHRKCEIFGKAYLPGFTGAGGQVIPDPEPTNAEKLASLLKDYLVGADDQGDYEDLARVLDEQGVRVPGVDDGH